MASFAACLGKRDRDEWAQPLKQFWRRNEREGRKNVEVGRGSADHVQSQIADVSSDENLRRFTAWRFCSPTRNTWPTAQLGLRLLSAGPSVRSVVRSPWPVLCGPKAREPSGTCRTCVKTVDLTKNGRAIPEVDALAAVPLTLWADEQGYTKISRNIFNS